MAVEVLFWIIAGVLGAVAFFAPGFRYNLVGASLAFGWFGMVAAAL